ncbi:carbamoyltransferase HypF [Flagellimonas sp. HMM57]|uniref:carbamoyltransferase HypF n=1 Tax=unclassified Flagellimonas TaxID=2644544 RepID=UPI0013D6DE72|nr:MULTISPECIES: carbamoyltransferase HypF [unclassified Flagellimonas]UII75385.1 carbamoyltransferase HypF [Flagellimonas sp. HMM57]
MQQTFQIIISGQVQGVGFRPFVYNLAQKLKLKGIVCNNENGVQIQVNTSQNQANDFLQRILENPPVISNIQSHSLAEISFQEYIDFRIVPSALNHKINIPLTPDFAICEACKTEIRDKDNRRFGYAFTTCTNCGPRFAITTKFPFERANTTISEFQMCSSCESEYMDATHRRFHSQTNSCMDCGIVLTLTNVNGEQIESDQSKIIQKVGKLILEGAIVALKNTNGYLLCCDAKNKTAIERLRAKKQRPSKPFALLYPSLEKIKTDFEVNVEEETALKSAVAPIVILNPTEAARELKMESIAPRLHQLGVMLPSSALLTLLIDSIQIPIIATSGNIHGSPIISEEKKAIEELAGVADYFLHHNLEIVFPQDDSVLRFAGEHQITLRRSRGLAPNYLESNSGGEKILAMGAHLKSTFTFVPNAHTYVSQYFGNLDSFDVLERFQTSIDQFQQLFQTKPETILIDAHPQYQSSILGKELSKKWNTNLISIQHHKAHFASVLGEHKLFETKEKILGVVWDGTGLGEDNAIWGGEFFAYENCNMERLTHFEYVDWLAADKMAKEPRLSLLSLLPEKEKNRIKNKFTKTEWKVYNTMLAGNTLKTSSVGRLFDAVASLLKLIDVCSYEGEAAMLLETKANAYSGGIYIDFLEDLEFDTVPSKKIIQSIYRELERSVSIEQIAASFIHTLALVVIKVAKKNGLNTIACSGGVFQNVVLVDKLTVLAEKQEIKLKFNRILSSNDENISFGQLCYYQHIKN